MGGRLLRCPPRSIRSGSEGGGGGGGGASPAAACEGGGSGGGGASVLELGCGLALPSLLAGDGQEHARGTNHLFCAGIELYDRLTTSK